MASQWMNFAAKNPKEAVWSIVVPVLNKHTYQILG